MSAKAGDKESTVVEKGALLYEGKAKRLYATPDNNILWVEYLDQATAFNGEKKDQIAGKAVLNNKISSRIFEKLHKAGVNSHFVEQLSENEQLVRRVQIIPLEVVVRNTAAGSLTKRLGIPEGMPLEQPLVEFFYKDDDLGDPLVTDDHIRMMDIATDAEIQKLKDKALTVNTALKALFADLGINLIDFKLEFGRTEEGEILLADEVSPDTARLWDLSTGAHLDKDVYRRDLGDLVSVYQVVLNRLEEQ